MNMDQEQMTIFDALPEDERKKFVAPTVGKDAKPQTSRTKTAVANKRVDEPEPNEYDLDRVVYYAGHRLDVPSRTMKLEDVRAWLEETFPELTKERVELVYDKETGHVVPVLKGHKKGAETITVYTEPPEGPLPVYYYLDSTGRVLEVRRTQTGIFTVPKLGKRTLRVVRLFVPKVPMTILDEITQVFREEPDTEHLAYIVWDEENEYSVHWPMQSGTAVSVVGDGFVETETRFVVAHIHSHGRLPAFFSRIDDADEVRTGFYGVMGAVDTPCPQFQLRYSCGGQFVKLHPGGLFAGMIERVVNLV